MTHALSDPIQRYHALRIQTHTISSDALAHLRATSPDITKEQLMFLVWLSHQEPRCIKKGCTQENCTHSRGILIPYSIYTSFTDSASRTKSLIAFLDLCKETLMPTLKYTPHSYVDGLCTVITHTGIQKIIDTLLYDALHADTDERVFIHTMRKASDRNKRSLASEIETLLLSAKYANVEQKAMADYLNTRRYALYEMKKRYKETLKLSISLDDATSKEHHMLLLMDIRDMQKPFYPPLRNSKSPRLYGTAPQFLTAKVRKLLYPHWIDLDLRSAQLAIIAYRFGATQIKTFLAKHGSFWREAVNYLGLASDTVTYELAKPFIKKFVYSLVYGMTPLTAWYRLKKGIASLPRNADATLLTHPLIREVITVVETAKRDIITKKGIEGAYGFIPFDAGDTPESILACCVQSYELACIYGVYADALKREKNDNVVYDIVLHAHDGVSIAMRKGASLDSILPTLQKSVQCHALKHGIVIELEAKIE